jgi:hypothetical protein
MYFPETANAELDSISPERSKLSRTHPAMRLQKSAQT